MVFPHDLDHSAIIAATGATGPSVVQIRTQDVLPAAIARQVVEQIKLYSGYLQDGAIMVIEEGRARVRILPLRGKSN